MWLKLSARRPTSSRRPAGSRTARSPWAARSAAPVTARTGSVSWRESHATSTAPSTREIPRTAQVSHELAAEEAAGPAASTVHGCPRPAGPVRTSAVRDGARRPASRLPGRAR